VLFDGSVNDEDGFVAIGGHAEELTAALRAVYEPAWDLPTALRKAIGALAGVEERTIEPATVEAGVLERSRPQRRKFRRISDADVSALLG
jgi:proteasome alpha subunit